MVQIEICVLDSNKSFTRNSKGFARKSRTRSLKFQTIKKSFWIFISSVFFLMMLFMIFADFFQAFFHFSPFTKSSIFRLSHKIPFVDKMASHHYISRSNSSFVSFHHHFTSFFLLICNIEDFFPHQKMTEDAKIFSCINFPL